MLGAQIKRLAKQSAIYGLGGIVSRLLAIFLLPLYTTLPRHPRLREDRDDPRSDDGRRRHPALRNLERVLPLLLRLDRCRAPHAHRAHVVLVHDGDGDGRARPRLRLRDAARPRTALRRRPVARPRRLRRPLGADELPAADVAVPRRRAAGRLRVGDRRERPHHRRHDGAARRRPRQGRDRSRRRQLHRDARRLLRAARLPPLPARSRVRPQAAARDEQVRTAARPVGARALGDQLHRPLLRRRVQGTGRGRRVLARRADRVGDRLPHGGLPARVAGVRVLDRGRGSREANVCVRAHVPAARVLVDVPRPRAALAVARADPRAERGRVLARVGGRRDPRVRSDGVCRLHRPRDRHRPRAAHAVQLDRDRRAPR